VGSGLYAFVKSNAFAKTYTFLLGEEVMCINKTTRFDLLAKRKMEKYIWDE
jgi:hypothetical protein